MRALDVYTFFRKGRAQCACAPYANIAHAAATWTLCVRPRTTQNEGKKQYINLLRALSSGVMVYGRVPDGLSLFKRI